MGLARSAKNRVILGVCGGLGETLHVAPAWLRLAFIVAGLASGVGVAVYLVVGALMLPAGFDEGSLLARLRANLAITGQELRAFFLRALDLAQSAALTLRGSAVTLRWRPMAGGILLAVGVTMLCASFGLFWWLTGWRVLALCLALVGLGALAYDAKPAAPPEGTEEPS